MRVRRGGSERESFFTLGRAPTRSLLGAVLGGLAVQLAVVDLPVLQGLFGTRALGPVQLAVVLVASTAAFIAVEIEKWLGRRRSPSRDAAASPAEGPVTGVPEGP